PDINQKPWQVFPNPSTNEVYFRVNQTSYSTGQIIIFSASGNQIEVINLKAGVETYRLQNKEGVHYLPGIYIAKLYLDKELKSTVKVMIAE
ncbi:MAG: T9SS type A sorting domain-containing protein, partial [Bacteroidota bacterium]